MVYQGESHWIVQSPQSNEYQYFNYQEYGILKKLDGTISYRELCHWFDAHFAPYKIDFRDLTEVISKFAQHSLLEPTSGDVGSSLWDQGKEKRRKELLQKLKNPLSIRWKGWDPEWFIEHSFPIARHLFSPAAAIAALCVLISALISLLVNYEQFSSRAPDLWSMFDSANWLSLGSAIAITKLLHELGHAYVHKLFGGQCHQIGVMIFYFMPTLYCDTSDSWRLPNKWHRIGIALGGVYVELIIFSLATFGWLFSQIGVWETFCLNLMFVCSISAVITNGNPLLKYDGYYALADLLEIPNLASKANERWKQLFLRTMGDHRQVDPWTSEFNKQVYLVYGFGAYCFRVMLVGGIALYLVQQFKPYGLHWIAMSVALLSFASTLLQPIKGLYKHFFDTPGNFQYMNRTRTQQLILFVVAVTLLATVVPFPYSLPAECSVELNGGKSVISRTGGIIHFIHAAPGDFVGKNEPIISLRDTKLKLELMRIEQDLEETRAKIKSRQSSSTTASNIETLSYLQSKENKLAAEYALQLEKSSSLVIRSPLNGVLYGVAISDSSSKGDSENLYQAQGNLLDTKNLGAWLPSGQEICKVGPANTEQANAFVASLSIEQRFGGKLEKGLPVSLILESGSVRFSGKISKIANVNSVADEIPESVLQVSTNPAVQRANEIANSKTRKDVAYKDGQTLASTLIQAEVELDACPHVLNLNSKGMAFIHLGGRSIAWRMKHWVNETIQFNF